MTLRVRAFQPRGRIAIHPYGIWAIARQADDSRHGVLAGGTPCLGLRMSAAPPSSL